MKKRRIGLAVFIGVVLVIDLLFCLRWIAGYRTNVKEINELTETMEIAEKFMRPEYNGKRESLCSL